MPIGRFAMPISSRQSELKVDMSKQIASQRTRLVEEAGTQRVKSMSRTIVNEGVLEGEEERAGVGSSW